MQSGIYSITNKVNGRKYYGSTVAWTQRKSKHKRELARGIHRNEHLQRAWRKYGAENFEFKFEEAVPAAELLQTEQRYIDSNPDGYNIAKVAGASQRGRPISAAHKRRISRANKGRRHTASALQKMRGQHTGPLTAEHRRKISAAGRDKRYGKPARGYGFHKRSGKWRVRVLDQYYGLVDTEAEAIKRVAEIRTQLKQVGR